MTALQHKFAETNRIKMHYVEQGEGPLVVLCHGFPESWYSWRHQIPALAAAGFRVVAPDQRGYGQTDRPEAIDAYNIFQLTGDIVGLVHGLGEEEAIIAGHDWGAPVAWTSSILRPDIFKATILLSVPYLARGWGDPRPTDAMKNMAPGMIFYQYFFQEPGRAEAEFEADVDRTVRMFLYSASGDPPPDKRWRFVFPEGTKFLDACSYPETLPSWLTEEDVKFFVGEFERTGFRSGLNWYRNIDRLWEWGQFLNGRKLEQPTLFVAGEGDAVLAMYPQAVEQIDANVPNLRKKVIIPGAGHWIQQERPKEVNELMLEFLRGL